MYFIKQIKIFYYIIEINSFFRHLDRFIEGWKIYFQKVGVPNVFFFTNYNYFVQTNHITNSSLYDFIIFFYDISTNILPNFNKYFT